MILQSDGQFMLLKGLVKKKYERGGGGGAERGWVMRFEPCARGGSCNYYFQLPLGGGSPYFIT